MFGKPHWFKKKSFGWGLTPVSWQGWIYTLVWSGVMVAPFSLLLGWHLVTEAMVWLGASLGTLIYDVYLIMKQMDGQPSSIEPSVEGVKDSDLVNYLPSTKVSTPPEQKNYDYYIGDDA